MLQAEGIESKYTEGETTLVTATAAVVGDDEAGDELMRVEGEIEGGGVRRVTGNIN